MNQKGFIFIIVLITVALIGLMVIQSYWIKNAITVKEANFVRDVNEAMSIVVYKLEKIEAASRIQSKMNYMQQRQKWLQSIDSLNQSFIDGTTSFSDPWDFNRFLQKSMLAQDVLESMIYDYSNIAVENRINITVLDSLISNELVSKGVNTIFEFGIFSPVRNFMPIQKTGKYPKELLNKGFSFALFPSDMFSSPDYLMVYFPNEKRFLITQLWGTLSISIVFIIIIILSFAYTVITILKQKKISELKNDFINNMTHEFKTPISTISLACEALSDKDIIKSASLLDNYINIINEENRRLGGMAERILQSASLEKGQIILKHEEVDAHEIINESIKNIQLQFIDQSFDAVITNPPFFKFTGDKNQLNDLDQLTYARHEILINLEDIIRAGSYLLKFRGNFTMVHRADRLADILELMKKYKIEPKRIRFCHTTRNKAAKIILFEGLKGAEAGLVIQPPLYINNDDGSYTEEVSGMFG